MLIPVSIHKTLDPPEMLDDSGRCSMDFQAVWSGLVRGGDSSCYPVRKLVVVCSFVEDFLAVRTTLLTNQRQRRFTSKFFKQRLNLLQEVAVD